MRRFCWYGIKGVLKELELGIGCSKQIVKGNVRMFSGGGPVGNQSKFGIFKATEGIMCCAATLNSKENYQSLQARCFCATSEAETTSSAPVGGIVEIPLAQTGEGIADCELLRWFIQEGDQVEEFQPLCEVQSDKATIEITSRYQGKVSKVNFMPGAIVKVGETLLEMITGRPTEGSSSEHFKLSSSAERNSLEKKASDSEKVLATPAVRSLAREHGINLADVVGSGEAGRILKDDVLRLASAKEALEEEMSGISATKTEDVSMTSLPAKPAVASFQGLKKMDEDEMIFPAKPEAASSQGLKRTDEDEIIPVRGFRRIMAKTMTAAAAVPHFHYMEEISMDALVKLKSVLQPQTDSKLTYLPFLIKALSLALFKYPILNSHVNQDASEIRCKACHNVGVAMATGCGLIVPNIKQVQDLSVKEIAEELSRLSKLAAEGKVSPEDVTDGTITVSNFGAIGGKFGSPVLNLPEVAILAMGRIQKLPRFDGNGQVYPASMMNVTCGADHRVIDGATIANFCNEWKGLAEHPEQWLLHLR